MTLGNRLVCRSSSRSNRMLMSPMTITVSWKTASMSNSDNIRVDGRWRWSQRTDQMWPGRTATRTTTQTGARRTHGTTTTATPTRFDVTSVSAEHGRGRSTTIGEDISSESPECDIICIVTRFRQTENFGWTNANYFEYIIDLVDNWKNV